jgi:hypothetical protein
LRQDQQTIESCFDQDFRFLPSWASLSIHPITSFGACSFAAAAGAPSGDGGAPVGLRFGSSAPRWGTWWQMVLTRRKFSRQKQQAIVALPAPEIASWVADKGIVQGSGESLAETTARALGMRPQEFRAEFHRRALGG